jgi:hypothetical protein
LNFPSTRFPGALWSPLVHDRRVGAGLHRAGILHHADERLAIRYLLEGHGGGGKIVITVRKPLCGALPPGRYGTASISYS